MEKYIPEWTRKARIIQPNPELTDADRLLNLADTLKEDILALTDEEILAEAAEDSPEICPKCHRKMPADGGSLGNLIRAQRMKLQMTLRDVERVTEGKISNGYLSQIETGKIKDPSISTILTIGAALCLSLEEISRVVQISESLAPQEGKYTTLPKATGGSRG